MTRRPTLGRLSLRRPTLRRSTAATVAATLIISAGALFAAAAAVPTARISGNGSSWAGNAMSDWVSAVKAQGVTVDFTPDGSSSGRKNFAQGLADFAVSEIPYTGDTADPQDSARPNFKYGLVPAVAGGTSFMYNLPVGGKRFTKLNLSQAALAKIFSGQVTKWNDPVIAATNPGVALPAQRITVVVRSDGSGATAQFTLWMLRQFPGDYAKLCAKTGCNKSHATSYYPYQGLSNFTAQSGSNGVTTYTSNTPYTINYDEYSYALGVGFPVAKIKNAAGFYTVPTDSAVAVALSQAKINMDKTSLNYLSQDLSKVYAYKDPRTYPISAYSYLIVPKQTHGSFNTGKGATLGYFSTFSLCEGQRTMGALGYSPLPMNLVLAAMDQVLAIPGVDAATKKQINNTKAGVKSGTSNPCNNPTFKPGDSPSHNILTDTAPFPAGCDDACAAPWAHKGIVVRGGGAGGGNTPGANPTGGASGSDPNNPGVPGGGGTPGANQGCDPNTGVCSDPAQAAGGPLPQNTSAVIDGQSTWGSVQWALILCAVFVFLLVLAPPLLARSLDSRRRSAAPAAPAGSIPTQPHGPGQA
ncbi:substrate-binding domain-containing protein [Nocardioides marmorisolisilvae]|uniref:Phosphate ABC transporter substrate-binding protein n=1 Tax=Nocardioides marmorisolisilvae TaxID=1542737 RepID=A0A3N0DWQ3_9ACTN|nr:substrate-binding domain-containing protein [Nocardioides marmorisolisilvae]RNL79981.1 phosphate ABC transporter substrate-binding protein [Nocardioides marmorisolisilvae]